MWWIVKDCLWRWIALIQNVLICPCTMDDLRYYLYRNIWPICDWTISPIVSLRIVDRLSPILVRSKGNTNPSSFFLTFLHNIFQFLLFIIYFLHDKLKYTKMYQLKDMETVRESEKQNQMLKKKEGKINIWSYNVFLRPPPIKNNNDDYKSQRFNIITKKISMYHIVCFQEIFQVGSFRVEDMIAEGIRQGFFYWAQSDPISFWGPIPVDSGLLVLSKFPILQSKFFSFGLGVFSDSSSDKGYIYCKIDIQGNILHLFNVHLQASYLTSQKSPYYKQLSLAARRYQAKLLKNEISKHLQKQYKEKDLILMLGDYNINAHNQIECLSRNTMIKAFIPEQFHQYEQFIQLMEGKSDNKHILDQSYKIKELLLENYGYHPPTYGLQDVMVLTHKDQYGIPQRLDYAFQIQQENCQPSLVPIIESCMIEKAKVEGQPFTQLSDHYGINLKLMVKK